MDKVWNKSCEGFHFRGMTSRPPFTETFFDARWETFTTRDTWLLGYQNCSLPMSHMLLAVPHSFIAIPAIVILPFLDLPLYFVPSMTPSFLVLCEHFYLTPKKNTITGFSHDFYSKITNEHPIFQLEKYMYGKRVFTCIKFSRNTS